MPHMNRQNFKKGAYYFHADPGHGWLAVKRAELERLGIMDKVSHYSYTKGATVYLEEDCDLALFVKAKEALNEPVPYFEKYTDKHHPIRSYDRVTNICCTVVQAGI